MKTAALLSLFLCSAALAQPVLFTRKVPSATNASGSTLEVPGSLLPLDAGVGGTLLFFSGTLTCTGPGDPCGSAALETTTGSNWAHYEVSSSLSGGQSTRIFGLDYTTTPGTTLHFVTRALGSAPSVRMDNLQYVAMIMPPTAGVVFNEVGIAANITATDTSWTPVVTAHAAAAVNYVVLASIEVANATNGVAVRLRRPDGINFAPLPTFPAQGDRSFFYKFDGQRTTWTMFTQDAFTIDAGVTLEAIANPRVDGGTATGATAQVYFARIVMIPFGSMAIKSIGFFGSPTGGYNFGLAAHAQWPEQSGFLPGAYLLYRDVGLAAVGPTARVDALINGVVVETSGEGRYVTSRQVPLGFADVVATTTGQFSNDTRVIGNDPLSSGFLWGGGGFLSGPFTVLGDGPTVTNWTFADGGNQDGGSNDAGPPDAGPPDAGPPDAGPPDAGPPDAGPPDAGPPDAGPPDAGPPDAGSPDAGTSDAGSPDAGSPDAGSPDAGTSDAGANDSGTPDSGIADAGEFDAGSGGGSGGSGGGTSAGGGSGGSGGGAGARHEFSVGCGCGGGGSTSAALAWGLALLLGGAFRRRSLTRR